MNRTVLVGLLLALALGLTACGGARAHRRRSAPLLTIFAVVAQQGPYADSTRDVIDAEKLALSQVGNMVGPFRVRLTVLDGVSPGTGQANAVSADVVMQRIDRDPTAVAALSEATPGSAIPVPSLHDSPRILQVIAGEAAPQPAGPAAQTHVVAFGPSDAAEAMAELQFIRSQQLKRLLILSDGSAYGRMIAGLLAAHASAFGIQTSLRRSRAPIALTDLNLITEVARARPDAILLAGVTSPTTTGAWNLLAAGFPTTPLFGPSGLDTDSFISSIAQLNGPAMFLDEPGLVQANLSPAAQAFIADFASAYRHRPRAAAFYAYGAMEAILTAIHGAGARARDPAATAEAFLALRDVPSVIGSYSVQPSGTTTLVPSFIFSTITLRARVPDRVVLPTQSTQ